MIQAAQVRKADLVTTNITGADIVIAVLFGVIIITLIFIVFSSSVVNSSLSRIIYLPRPHICNPHIYVWEQNRNDGRWDSAKNGYKVIFRCVSCGHIVHKVAHDRSSRWLL